MMKIKKKIAQEKIQQLNISGKYDKNIVTEIVPFEVFYPAEAYHQNYYDKNQSAPYCRFVIDPKMSKLLKQFGNEVKEEYKQG